MKRIPEPELMSNPEQARAYADADFSEPHDAFVHHFQNKFQTFKQGNVIDLGCGTADVIIRFAHAFPDAQIIGVDGSEAMLEIGHSDILKSGLEEQIILKKCFLPDFQLEANKYDAVISNSLLHHLDNPFVLWNTVTQCSKTNTVIFIMDLMRPVDVDSARIFVQKYAAEGADILKEDFYNSLLAAYTINEVEEQLHKKGLDYLSVEPVSDRHMIIWGTFNGY